MFKSFILHEGFLSQDLCSTCTWSVTAGTRDQHDENGPRNELVMDVTQILIDPSGSGELMANVFDMCNPILRYTGCRFRWTRVGLAPAGYI